MSTGHTGMDKEQKSVERDVVFHHCIPSPRGWDVECPVCGSRVDVEMRESDHGSFYSSDDFGDPFAACPDCGAVIEPAEMRVSPTGLERVEAATGPDNALDIAVDIALFTPDARHVSVRANAAGTKIVYSRRGGGADTYWANDWTSSDGLRASAIRTLIAQSTTQNVSTTDTARVSSTPTRVGE